MPTEAIRVFVADLAGLELDRDPVARLFEVHREHDRRDDEGERPEDDRERGRPMSPHELHRAPRTRRRHRQDR